MPSRLTAHATVEFGATSWGGIASALDLIVAAAVRAGEPTLVVTLGPTDAVWPLGSAVNLVTIGMPELADRTLYRSPRRVELGPVASGRMAATLRELHPSADIDLYVHSEELGRLFDVAHARRKVFVSHGLASQEHPGRPDLIAQERATLELADTVVAVTPGQAEAIHRAHPHLHRIGVLPLPLELLAEEIRPRTPDEREPGTIVAAGRAVPQKGFDLLLSGIEHLGPDWVGTLTIYLGHGNPDYETRCRELAAADGAVRIEPWQDRDGLLRALRRAAVVCVPSRFEPLGLIAAEALGLGIPVVASAVGGLVDLLKDPDVGVLVPVHTDKVFSGPNPADLATSLSAALHRTWSPTSGPERLRLWSLADHLAALAELGT